MLFATEDGIVRSIAAGTYEGECCGASETGSMAQWYAIDVFCTVRCEVLVMICHVSKMIVVPAIYRTIAGLL